MQLAGCSTDTLDAQKDFAQKLGGLRFPLIADPDGSVARAYGAYKEEWKVATRATAVIAEDGTILKSYPDAPPHGKGHAEEVFGDVQKLLA